MSAGEWPVDRPGPGVSGTQETGMRTMRSPAAFLAPSTASLVVLGCLVLIASPCFGQAFIERVEPPIDVLVRFGPYLVESGGWGSVLT